MYWRQCWSWFQTRVVMMSSGKRCERHVMRETLRGRATRATPGARKRRSCGLGQCSSADHVPHLLVVRLETRTSRQEAIIGMRGNQLTWRRTRSIYSLRHNAWVARAIELEYMAACPMEKYALSTYTLHDHHDLCMFARPEPRGIFPASRGSKGRLASHMVLDINNLIQEDKLAA